MGVMVYRQDSTLPYKPVSLLIKETNYTNTPDSSGHYNYQIRTFDESGHIGKSQEQEINFKKLK
jgi:hypothetical protein